MASQLSLELQIRADAQRAVASLRSLDRSLYSLSRSSQSSATAFARSGRAARDADSSYDRLASTVKRTAGALISLAAARQAATTFVRINAEAQKLRASLTTVTGDADVAAAAWANLNAFAQQTPFTLDEAVQGFIKLQARGLTPSIESLRSYGNTAAAMGKSLDQMVEAVADAATGQFQRLDEFGINASVQGNKIIFTFRNVTTEVERSAGAIESYLKRLGDVNFATAMTAQMSTISGALSNLEDEWTRFWTAIGDTGLADAVANGIGRLASMIGSLREQSVAYIRWAAGQQGADPGRSAAQRLSDVIYRRAAVERELAGLADAPAWEGDGRNRKAIDKPGRAADLVRQLELLTKAEDEARARLIEIQAKTLKALTPVSAAASAAGTGSAMASELKGVKADLAAAVELMIADAAAQGIKLAVSDGKRTYAESVAIWQRALKEAGGNVALARKNAALPGASKHISGDAVDVSGDAAARQWMQANAARYGLSTYRGPNYKSHLHLQMMDGGAMDKAASAQAAAAKQREDAAVAGLTERYRALAEVQAEGRRVTESLRTPAEEHIANMDRLVWLYRSGAISIETYNRGVSASAEALTKAGETAKEASQAAQDVGWAFSSAFEDAILSGSKLRDVLKGMLQDIARIALRETFTKPLGNLVASAVGNVFGGVFGGARAAGGPVAPGRAYLVGEQGPELFVPGMSGGIVPSAGKINVTVNNNAAGDGWQARTRQDSSGGLTIDIVRAALADDAARGGVPWTRGLEAAYGLGRAR